MHPSKIALIFTAALLAACSKGPEDPASQASSKDVAKEAASALPAGVSLVETFDGDGAEIAIPYSKYKLDNGLTVVLHEDDSDPLVHVDVTYHVGSNREDPGRSGFAHFFEHMMFQGSVNVADEEHFRIIQEAGGTLNGTTNTDRTNYYETVPANQLETVLWLEADRMGVFLDAVTEEKFEVQRETVKNERGQRVDNRPYGRALETMYAATYPDGHPYSWPVIGWLEDLNRADLNDLKRFFLRWYGPNNATLTIGGDIDKTKTLEWVVKYFGTIPAGPEVEDLPAQPATLDSDRYVTLEDNIHLPALAMMIPTVHYNHPDEPALDAAAEILGQGQDSMLYQRLVQTGRAVQASVSHSCKELACEMWFIVIQNPASGESLAEMEQAVRDTLIEFAERGVTKDDLVKFKAGYESSRVFGLQSVAGKVSTLAAFETFTGSPKGIDAEIDAYLSVETDDVTRVFEQYIADKPAVLLSVVPNGKPELAAAEQNYEWKRTIPESYGDDDEALALRPVQDNFDRSVQPTAGVNPQVELPTIQDGKLANGVRLLAVQNDETPTVTVRAVFDVGQRDEPRGKAGLTSLMTSLMTEATTERSAAEFAEALNRLGASISVAPGQYETTVTLNVLSKHLDEAMPLMMERILKPAFTEADFERIKQQTIEGLQQARKTPQGLATRAVGAVMRGQEHPLSFPTGGLPGTVAKITLEDIKGYYEAHFPAHLSGVTVSTSLPHDTIVKALDGLAKLEVSTPVRPAIALQKPEIDSRTVYLVNKEGAAQSSLRVSQHALPYDALGDYYLAYLGNFPLGGNFNSRINLNLREDKGYTYGARTYLMGEPQEGMYMFSSEVKKDATADALNEVITELESFDAEGMTEAEFNYLRSAIGQQEARSYETPAAKLGLLNRILQYDLPLDYRSQQNAILQETDRKTLNKVITDVLKPEEMAIVVVGDAASIREEVEALGMPIVELDEDGYVKEADESKEQPAEAPESASL
ncbi:Peptidase M16 inactive domain protein [Microbulbifer aggregans]|uniref:Peptidase M16 inactive domain protein n=1 Tax=Microbulbifer aggregans TaxID=1769779 RepID=A0A1C9W5X6_9GAMM|nr:pitrilysin family protein [Microbulbifer aggregans]AOS96540.1 Peptidase M16 inactive domain protein [Microbulbifer aggregans]